MKEYKTVMWPAEQKVTLGAKYGVVNTTEFDEYLNAMAVAGWELQFTECLNHQAGTRAVLCIFVKESTARTTGLT